jgi:hypothetical protein
MTLQPPHIGAPKRGVEVTSVDKHRPRDINEQAHVNPPPGPGGDVEDGDCTRFLVFTLCHPKELYEVEIKAKPNDNDFDTKVFSDIKEEYFKARGRWAKFLGRYSFWDLSELRVVMVLSTNNVD